MADRIAVVVVSHRAACDAFDETTAVRAVYDRCRRLRKVKEVKVVTTARLLPLLPDLDDVKPGVTDITPGWWNSMDAAADLARYMRKAVKTQADILLVAAEFPLLSESSLNGLLGREANCYTGAALPVWPLAPEGSAVFSGAVLFKDADRKWTNTLVAPHESLCLLNPTTQRLLGKARELGYAE
jgi:hypothetical protein